MPSGARSLRFLDPQISIRDMFKVWCDLMLEGLGNLYRLTVFYILNFKVRSSKQENMTFFPPRLHMKK